MSTIEVTPPVLEAPPPDVAAVLERSFTRKPSVSMAVPVPVRREPVSPFVLWSAKDRAPIPEESPELVRSLVLDLLRHPAAVVERLLDPAALQSAVLGSLGVIVCSTGLFTACVMAGAFGERAALSAALIIAGNTLLAVAAALGPIYAASLLLAVRLPLSRLVATMLASVATGSLILAGLAPVPYLLWKIDPVWAGPLSLMGAFLGAGAVSGGRIFRLLRELAEQVTRTALGDPTATLAEDDAFRVRRLAETSMAVLGFTSALSFWAFDAFLIR